MSKNTIKILFMDYPEKIFHIREIAKRISVNPMTARKYLTELKEEEFVIEVPSKLKVKDYKLNIENDFARLEKMFYNIKKIFSSGLIDFLNKELAYPGIILFGSMAKGEDNSDSDIDLFVYSETKKELEFGTYEKKLKKNIQLFLMNRKEFERNKEKNKNLINNILNGIKISGFIEVFG